MKIFISLLLIFFLFSCSSIANKKNLIVDEYTDILLTHKNNILFPEDISNIPNHWKEVQEKFTFTYQWTNLLVKKKPVITKNILKDEFNNQYFFETYRDGKPLENGKLMIQNGMEYHSFDNGPYQIFDLYDGCTFNIGKCDRLIGGKREDTIETRFEKGLWIRRHSGIGLADVESITIYDKRGLILYNYYHAKSLINEIKHKTIRIE